MKYFLCILILTNGFLIPLVSHATVGLNGITFTYNSQIFTADRATVESWRGITTLPAENSITVPHNSIVDMIQESFGQAAATPSNIIYQYRPGLIYHYLKTIAPSIEQPAQEPSLTIINNRATVFTEPEDGIMIDFRTSLLDAITALTSDASSSPISVSVNHPQKSLSETNNLGITELLARGESSFKGSPNNRRHNIKVGVEKMTGVIIAPGDTFSFNKYLGPVENGYGFLPELVIKASGTIPELGGGLCQVSSTTFRAAMIAGLPIIERRNHAYAVSYYSPQGTDATIYPGVVDLKFTNDTPGHILIWPHFKDNNTLDFDFYGTKDNRVIEIKKPIQFDRKPDGSMKATWERIITKNDVPTDTIFKSTYQPPALFHKQEQYVTASSTPKAQIPKSAQTTTPAPVLH